MANPEHKTPYVEVDASTLTTEEWFFLWAANGLKPDANLKESHDWHTRSLGMTPKEKQTVFRKGAEALMARGFIVQDRNTDGSLKFDQSSPPQPVYRCTGRIISRVTSFNPSTKVN